MARKHEAAKLLQSGLSPSHIAAQMGISPETVIGYLHAQVGEGVLQRSEIIFSIEASIRAEVDRLVAMRMAKGRSCDRWYIRSYLDRRNWPKDRIADAEIYLKHQGTNIALGDLFEWIYRIETTLHLYVKRTLQDTYGQAWWRRGVPVGIRTECAKRLEEDEEPAEEPYSYTNFIDMKRILDDQWANFLPAVPKTVAKEKKRLMTDLAKLNLIRNRVMHPAKGVKPGQDVFRFVYDFLAFLHLDDWKFAADREDLMRTLNTIIN